MVLGQTKIKMFLCPSDTMDQDEPVYNVYVGFNTWYDGGGTQFFQGWRFSTESTTPGPSRALARTNYQPIGGCIGRGKDCHPFFAQWEGVHAVRTRWKLGQMTVMDGTSNTIVLGEGLGAFSHYADGTNTPTRERLWSWMGAGAFATTWGVQPPSRADWFNLSSRHAGSANMGWGDGSIRMVKYNRYDYVTPDWYLLMQLSGVHDGFTDDVTTLLE